jgi:F-type H+-transporting ATPase subunit gamma
VASLKAIRKRIVSVRNTQQVTKAMKMVSAAKLRRAQTAAEAAREYSNKLTDLLQGLAAGEAARAHPFMRSHGTGAPLLILITADKGLCGAYNANVLRMASSFVAAHAPDTALATVGRRGRDFFRRRGGTIVLEHVQVPPSIDLAREIARAAGERFLRGEASEVHVVYTRFRSAISQVATLSKLLPLTQEEPIQASEPVREYLYEPDAESILGSLLPRYVETRIYAAMLESAASEHGARMTAMDNATRNASEMIERLTLAMNRARQAGITTELMEIVSGAEALKG